MTDAELDAMDAANDLQRWGNAGRRSGWGQREDGYWTPWHIANDAIIALRSDNYQLREQVEAFRREQNARSKIDPVTRLHNLCDHLAEQRRESPFTAESLELADASYKELCTDNAALRVERDAAFALLRVCQDSVHPDTRTVILALIGDAALLAGKKE